MQADIHSPATTIREALYFSARCRLMDVDTNQLNEFVEEVNRFEMSLSAYAPWQCTMIHEAADSTIAKYILNINFVFRVLSTTCALLGTHALYIICDWPL